MQEYVKQIESENHILRKQLNELYGRFEDKISELSTVKEIGSIIQYITSFEKTCLAILDVILKNTIAQNCSIMLLDQECKQLFLAAASDPEGNSYVIDAGMILSRRDLKYRFKVGQCAAGEVVRKKKPILVEDMDCSPYLCTEFEPAISIGSLLSLPLVLDDAVLGVINISHKEKNAFQPNDMRLFAILCDIVALLLLSSLGHERLKSSEEKYRVLAENASDGIAIIQDGRHAYANPKYAQITGYAICELEVTSPDTLYFIPGSDSQSSFSELMQDGGDTLGKLFEANLVRKGDLQAEVEISASATTHDGRHALILSVRDLTERKLLERQLRQAQKMEAVGTLAAGIAHDFNNLLQGIQGYADLLLLKLEQEGANRGTQELRRIIQAVQRGSGLTRQLLTFGRRIESNPCPVDLNRVVTQAVELLQRTIPKMIHVKPDLMAELYPINADPIQIDQVIMNMALNARDAMPHGGELLFETRNVLISESFCKTHIGALPGSYARLKISDTGEGIAPSIVEHIFDPFFTTKEVGKGTGLGLAIVYGIVKNHGGYMTCRSEPGKGATFEIYFPASDGKEQPEEATTEKASAEGGPETILVVDDEQMLRELVTEILSDFGYKVITCADGEEALELYRSRTEPIHLVVLDLNMPGMGGDQCLAELLKIDPTVKVLIASGYTPSDYTKVALQAGARGFLSKPYEMFQILKSIRELLDG